MRYLRFRGRHVQFARGDGGGHLLIADEGGGGGCVVPLPIDAPQHLWSLDFEVPYSRYELIITLRYRWVRNISRDGGNFRYKLPQLWDSTVSVYVIVKGRSVLYRINNVLRMRCPYVVTAGLSTPKVRVASGFKSKGCLRIQSCR